MGCGASQAVPQSSPYATGGAEPAPEAQPWREPSGSATVIVAFHRKEAAEEAAFLQKELSKTLGKRVRLDTEPPDTGRSVLDHVREAKAVVVLQSAGVLVEPMVLVELCAAVDAGIAIFGVALKGGPPPYSFDASFSLMKHLDTLLEQVAPGASVELQAHGVLLEEASHKLANTLPQTISRPMDVAASAKVLSATISDLAATIEKTASTERPPLPDAAVWLAQREPPPPASSITSSLLVAPRSLTRNRLEDMRRKPVSVSNVTSTAVAAGKRTFAAFLSHAKAEAAMEARFIQTQMEAMDPRQRRVFLDSDDLTDLRMLLDHVRDSDCLVLLLTRSVLTRPWCLLELMAAVEAQIPIVMVHLHGPSPYEEGPSLALLRHLDSLLEELSPGASELLRQHGVETSDAAHKLSQALVHVPTVALDTAASRSVLSASIEDLVERMQASPPAPPPPKPKAEWLAARDAMPPKSIVASFGSGGGGGGGSAAAHQVEAAVGAQLLVRSKGIKPLAPIAFLLQGVAMGAADAQHLTEDCALFASCAATVELLLLSAFEVEREGAALELIADALEEGIDHMSTLSEDKFALGEAIKRVKASEYKLHCFKGLCHRLHGSCTAKLQLANPMAAEMLLQADFEQSAQFDGLVERRLKKEEARATASVEAAEPEAAPVGPASAAQKDMLTAMLAQLATKHTAAAASMDAAQALESQNAMLVEQVRAMQTLMSQSGMMMQNLMKLFPVPSDEPERNQVIEKVGILDLPRPIVALDALLRKMVEDGLFGSCLVGIYVGMLYQDMERFLGCYMLDNRPEDMGGEGRWFGTQELGFDVMEDFPRKASA